VPQALGVMNLMLKDSDLMEGEKAGLVAAFDRVLGLRLTESPAIEPAAVLPAELVPLLAERAEARKAKDWARSDAIRDAFKAMGFALKDNPDGSVGWTQGQ
jgi:cysteinyl-tRNA synthetase